MLLLVIDTSGRNGTVALARAGEGSNANEVHLIEIAPLAGGAFSAQLVPQIAALLQKHALSKTDIAAFIVVSGPGSFTGLRVGLAAVKALAEILQKPIIPVSLLELLATAGRAQGKVVAALDGGRREVFFGEYKIADEVQTLREELLSQPEFLLAARESTVVTPDAALADAARTAGLPVVTVEPPNSEIIARFGWKKLQAGRTVPPEQLEANYMRRSDAEMYVKQSS